MKQCHPRQGAGGPSGLLCWARERPRAGAGGPDPGPPRDRAPRPVASRPPAPRALLGPAGAPAPQAAREMAYFLMLCFVASDAPGRPPALRLAETGSGSVCRTGPPGGAVQCSAVQCSAVQRGAAATCHRPRGPPGGVMSGEDRPPRPRGPSRGTALSAGYLGAQLYPRAI
jgi:hypothetical protein